MSFLCWKDCTLCILKSVLAYNSQIVHLDYARCEKFPLHNVYFYDKWQPEIPFKYKEKEVRTGPKIRLLSSFEFNKCLPRHQTTLCADPAMHTVFTLPTGISPTSIIVICICRKLAYSELSIGRLLTPD